MLTQGDLDTFDYLKNNLTNSWFNNTIRFLNGSACSNDNVKDEEVYKRSYW
jgi:hypothetical protein